MIAAALMEQDQREEQERQRSVAQQKAVEAMWDDVARRQREAWNALYQAPAPAAATAPPVAASPPDPELQAAKDLARRFVVPNARPGGAPVVRKAGFTFADVLRAFDRDFRRRYGAQLTLPQDKVLRELMACYTPLLGTHQWTCGDCGTVVELPNGCHNRHCCTCGDAQRRRWAEATSAQILPVEYCHLILTVPEPITRLALLNPRVVYPLIMREGAHAVLYCGRKWFDVELALLMLLHTWGQLVNNHVHTHSLLPFGGLRRGALEWITLSREQMEELLEHVAREFPRRLCRALRRAYHEGKLRFEGDSHLAHLTSPTAFEQWLSPLENMPWIVRCPEVWDRRGAGHGPEETRKVIAYLANYANRVALSDSRILNIDGEWVLLSYKDYRDGNQQKRIPVEGVKLIRSFLQHLLPRGMHHIRRYGWLSRRAKPEKLQWLRAYHGLPEPEEPDKKSDEAEVSDKPPRTQACRFCPGQMQQTGRRRRPSLDQVLRMRLLRFYRAQAGVRVRLGDKLPTIEATEARSDLSPAARDRSVEIRRQLAALLTSSYL